MTIAFDATSYSGTVFSTSQSWTHTATAGATVWAVAVVDRLATSATATYGGVAMTPVGSDSTARMAVFRLDNAPGGASTVVVTFNQGGWGVGAAISLTGVDSVETPIKVTGASASVSSGLIALDEGQVAVALVASTANNNTGLWGAMGSISGAVGQVVAQANLSAAAAGVAYATSTTTFEATHPARGWCAIVQVVNPVVEEEEPAEASASGDYSFDGAAVGASDPVASASGSVSFDGAAVGASDHVAQAAGSYSFLGTAQAAVSDRTAQASGSFSFDGAAVGAAIPVAEASGAYHFDGQAIGHRESVASATGSFRFDGEVRRRPTVQLRSSAQGTSLLQMAPGFNFALPRVKAHVGDLVVLDIFVDRAPGEIHGAVFNGEDMELEVETDTPGANGGAIGHFYRYLYRSPTGGYFSAIYNHGNGFGGGWAHAVVRVYSGVAEVGEAQILRGSASTPTAALELDSRENYVVHAFGGVGPSSGAAPSSVTGDGLDNIIGGGGIFAFAVAAETNTATTATANGTARQWISIAQEFVSDYTELPPAPSAVGGEQLWPSMMRANGAARGTIAVYEVAGTVGLVAQDPPPPGVYIWTQDTLDPERNTFDHHQIVYPAALTQLYLSIPVGVNRLIEYVTNTRNRFILSGSSQGGIVVSEFWKLLQPGGPLEEHGHRLLGVTTFGSGSREEGHTFPDCPDPGGRAIAVPLLMQNTPDYWWDFARPGDPITCVPDTPYLALTGRLTDQFLGNDPEDYWVHPRHPSWHSWTPDLITLLNFLLAFVTLHSYFGNWRPLAALGDQRSEVQIATDYFWSLARKPDMKHNTSNPVRVLHNGHWHRSEDR